MKLKVFISLLSLIAITSKAQIRTQIFADNYKTLLCHVEGVDFSLPIISLESEDKIEISFDEMSRNPQDLAYTIEHCTADWQPSNLDKIDYLIGFDNQDIAEYEYARNTTFDYTHYWFTIPNEDVRPTLSGNYVVRIFDKSEPEKTLLQTTFSITENIVPVEVASTPNTLDGVRTKYQQLDLRLLFSQSDIAPMTDEIKTYVQQNVRRDNMVRLTAPSYVRASDFIYENDKRLIFEGGCEYEKIDFSHIINHNGNVERIKFFRPYYHVDVLPGMLPSKPDYEYHVDENGYFRVWGQNITSEYDIDYSVVHFRYRREAPWFDGNVYVSGALNYGYLDEKNKMTYNIETNEYELDIVLKNGGYNYQYLFLPINQSAALTDPVTYSHWQTENTYTIYVYYRPISGRYDRLIKVHTFQGR